MWYKVLLYHSVLALKIHSQEFPIKIRVSKGLHLSLCQQIAQKKYYKFHCANIPISL